MLADRVFIGPETPSQRGADEHRARPAGHIGAGKVAASQDRDMHGAEVSRADQTNIHLGLLRHRHDRAALNRERLMRTAAAQRQIIDYASGLDAGQCTDTLQYFLKKADLTRG